MCLVDYKKVSIRKPLKVYKCLAVDKRRDNSELLISPYFPFWWVEGKEHSVLAKKPNIHEGWMNELGIYGNAFHSFKNKTDAAKEAESWAKARLEPCYVVAEFEIPADTDFLYKGKFDTDRQTQCYATEKMKLVGVLGRVQEKKGKYKLIWEK